VLLGQVTALRAESSSLRHAVQRAQAQQRELRTALSQLSFVRFECPRGAVCGQEPPPFTPEGDTCREHADLRLRDQTILHTHAM
jgi:hypothetical protein